jgi:hypothetical protein
MRREWTTAAFAAIALLAACGRTDPRCTAVHDAIVTTFSQSPDCPSPVGVCTDGTISSGAFAGTTTFVAMTARAGPSPDSTFYEGDLVITAADGTITLRDNGMLNGATNFYLEMQEVVSGTGGYQGYSGLLISQGMATATGFEGVLSGSICAPN